MKVISRLFRYEQINGGGLCPTYLHRWTLLSIGARKVYLHHFVGDDWSIDPHDHPKAFVSIGLAGEYLEDDFADLERPVTRRFVAPWIRRFPAAHRHRIRMTDRRSCWTLCIVGRTVREWGFWYCCKHWIKWDTYVWGGTGATRKSC